MSFKLSCSTERLGKQGKELWDGSVKTVKVEYMISDNNKGSKFLGTVVT